MSKHPREGDPDLIAHVRAALEESARVKRDLAPVVPSDDTQRIQESHVAMAHATAEVVELLLFPELCSA